MSVRCLIIQKGVVVNIAEVTPEVAAATGWPEAGIAQIGWKWIDGAAVPPERDIEAEWAAVRQQRSALLQDTVDRINPIRWDAMGSAERKAWAAYRQALLDLPSTFADPRDVKFPAPPPAPAGPVSMAAAPQSAESVAEVAEVLQEESAPEPPLPVVVEPEPEPEPELKIEAKAEPAPVTGKRKRAHHQDGRFRADNPATPDINEAFES